MELFSLLSVYLALFGVVLFVLLFGESEMFEGTAVETCHWVISDGLCVGCSWGTRAVLGKTMGARVEAVAEEWLCNRPNPAMQMVYVALVMGGYWTFCVHAYDLLGLYASSLHRITVPLAVVACIASWLATCWSDPGVVTRENLEAHMLAYPHDHVLYKPKDCPTTGLACPPRSKFCRVTRRRVAKFDHFCGWMNNAIGENNLRHFVTFLAAHVALCGYLAYLCFRVVYGELGRRGVWEVSFDGGGGVPVALGQDWSLLSRFCMYHFGPIITLGVFLIILTVMLGAFLGYHAWMIKEGVTTNETFKWKDHRRRVLRAARATSAEAKKAAAEEDDDDRDDGQGTDSDDDDDDDDDDDRDVGCVGATHPEKEKEREQEEQKKQKPGAGGAASGAGAKGGAADDEREMRERAGGVGGGGGLLSRIPFARRLGLVRGGGVSGGANKVIIDVPPPTRNIYDKGLRQNIAEVFFPPSQIAARALAAASEGSSSSRQQQRQKGLHVVNRGKPSRRG